MHERVIRADWVDRAQKIPLGTKRPIAGGEMEGIRTDTDPTGYQIDTDDNSIVINKLIFHFLFFIQLKRFYLKNLLYFFIKVKFLKRSIIK